MISIIEKPNLPKGEVKHIILGEKYKDMLEKPLISRGIIPVWLPDNPNVDYRLSGHADLSAVHLKENEIAIVKDDCIDKDLTSVGFKVKAVDVKQSSAYPKDVALNFCIVGEYCICNKKTASAELIASLPYKLIECTQGYTKCSVLVVDDNSIITSDRIIAEKAKVNGLDVLLIDDSFVKLEGFNKGFIGGSAFKISKHEIAFTGNINDRFCKELIESFLDKHSTKSIYLTDKDLFDIGSAIPLTEQI